jgi:hypothetical protein
MGPVMRVVMGRAVMVATEIALIGSPSLALSVLAAQVQIHAY